jgi:hypothetical protein
MSQNLGQVYFHCSNTKGVVLDQRGLSVVDLAEAYDAATSVVRQRLAAPCLIDWRDWVLHVSDEAGEEIFVLPFVSVIGKPH